MAELTTLEEKLKAGGLNLSAFFGAQPDSTAKLAGDPRRGAPCGRAGRRELEPS